MTRITKAGLAALLAVGCSRPESAGDRTEGLTTLHASLTLAEDADQDDVRNGLDLCPSTPADERTDGDGCGLVTQDSDLDGVGDGRDACPGTADGSHVDAMGCAKTQGGVLPTVAAHLRDTEDVFAIAGWNPTATGCGGSPIPRVEVDRDDDLVPDTMVVVTSLAGQSALITSGSPFNHRLSMNGLCATPDQAEVSIRFVDMLAPGFLRDDASTWSFRTVPAARLDHTSDFMFGTRFDVTGFTAAGVPAIAFNGLRQIFSHRDGIAEIRAFTDHTENLLDNLRLFVQPPNTRYGSDVTVNLDNGRVTFPDVSMPGNTFIAAKPDGDPPILPRWCGPSEPRMYFVIETSAETSGAPNQICVKYRPECAGAPMEILSLQQVCGFVDCGQTEWRSLPTTIDATAGLACADPGLSPFILMGTLAEDNDTTPPVVGTPIVDGLTRGPMGWILTFTVLVSDDRDPNPVLVCTPPSGTEFAGGTTTEVSCVATDASGNAAGRTFTVHFPPLSLIGEACLENDVCQSRLCVDGVCCATACGGGNPNDCQACSTAAGGTTNGTCTPLPADECTAASNDPSACDGEPACVELLGGTDEEGGLEITFLGPYTGDVRVDATGEGCPPTPGFEILSMDEDHGEGTYFDITAEPSTGLPQMKLCIHYPQGSMPDGGLQEQGLRINHGTTTGCAGPGDWTELIEAEPPDQPDMVNNIICAYTSSLSPFAIFVPVDADGPVFGNVPNTVVGYATSTAGAKMHYALPTAVDAVDGPVPVGCAPASGSIFAPGKTTVTCAASDTTGHTTTATFIVWVQYQAPADGSFFLKPPRPNGSSIFRIGKPVPVKFQLTGASKNITNLQARLIVTKISGAIQGTVDDDCDEDEDDTDFLFKYRKAKGIYVYRWKTRGESQGTYSLRADLGDEVVHEIVVSLKRTK
jgi:hypothetical protein